MDWFRVIYDAIPLFFLFVSFLVYIPKSLHLVMAFNLLFDDIIIIYVPEGLEKRLKIMTVTLIPECII